MYSRIKAGDGGYVEVMHIDGKVVLESSLDSQYDDGGPQPVFLNTTEVETLISVLQESISNVDA